MSNIHRSEQGMVSILVTMIMIIVITLIVVGFTQITNRNSREALDKQLSTQAFYAAESGVNQAIKYIDAGFSSGNLKAQTECNDTSGPQYGLVPVLDSTAGVAVTCLLVDPVNENVVTSADVGGSNTIPIDSVDSGGTPKNLTDMIVSWKSPDTTATTSGCTAGFAGGPGGAVGFPAALPATCSYGVLQLDLMQYQAPTQVKNAQTAANQTESYYLVPTTGGASVTAEAFTAGNTKAYVARATCNATDCRGVIRLDGSGGTKKYFARVSSIYRAAPTVVIDGTNNGTSGDAFFNGIFKIDATGKARDVLRRVQVRYNPYATGGSPFGALQTTSNEATGPGAGICKLLTVINTDVVSSGTCN